MISYFELHPVKGKTSRKGVNHLKNSGPLPPPPTSVTITGLQGAASCNCFLDVRDGQKKAANSLWLWPTTSATNPSAVAELKNEISRETCDMIQTEMSTLLFCWTFSCVLYGLHSCCYDTLISAVTWRHLRVLTQECCSEIKKYEPL